MPNRLQPELIAIANGVVYPFEAVIDSGNPNRYAYTAAISTNAFSGTITVYYVFQGTGVGTYTWSTTGTFEFTTQVFEISSLGWPRQTEVDSNQSRSFVWVRGQDGSVYKLELGFVLDANGYSGRVVAKSVEQERSSREVDSISSSFTSDQKKELVVSAEVSGSIFEVAGHADKNAAGATVTAVPLAISVKDDKGELQVAQISSALPVTPPLYLYSPSKLVTRVARKEAYARWAEKAEGAFVAQRPNSGRISFTNPEALTAGTYRLVLDCGNIGEVDSAFAGFNVNIAAATATVPATLLGKPRFSENPSMRFAVAGDLGWGSGADANNRVKEVSNLVKRLKLNDFFAIGDLDYNNASSFANLDTNIGSFYQELMYPYNGTYGTGAADRINRFWACPGNHDWGNTTPNNNGLQFWHQFFAGMFPVDPTDNTKVMRYFDVVRGDCHFFLLSTDTNEDPATNPDGVGRAYDSEQGQWLKAALKKSTARWKIVMMHHPPFASEAGKESTTFKWPFKEWGADMIIGAHAHNYERFDWNGLPVLVVGTGGFSIRNLPTTRRGDTYAVTFASGNATITISNSSVLKTGNAVTVTTTNAGFVANTRYFVRKISDTQIQLFPTELDSQRGTNVITPNASVANTIEVVETRLESLIGFDHRNGTDPSAYGVLVLETTPSRLKCYFINIDDQIRDEFELNAVRGEAEVQFELAADVTSAWTLELDWTNDQDFTAQGFNRTLAVYGYRLEKVESELYRISIDPYTTCGVPLVEKLATNRLTSGPIQFGTWIARYNSLGNIVDYFNELAVFPRNENYASPVPLADMLTGVTESKQDDVLIASSAVVSGVDPNLERNNVAATDLSVVISFPAGPHKVGDTVTFTATSATPNLTYVWTFWDGTTAYSTTNTINKKLNRGGTTPLKVEVSVLSPAGDTAYDWKPITVNAAPVVDRLEVSVNDQRFPYNTTFTVHAYDPEGTAVNVQWDRVVVDSNGNVSPSSPPVSIDEGDITPGSSTPKTTNRTIEQPETWQLTVTDADGVEFKYLVNLRGEAVAGPIISALADPINQRIGPNTLITFRGRAVDPNSRESLVTYLYEWIFWDGTTVPQTTMPKVGDFTFEATVTKSLASATPGRKPVIFKVTEQGTSLVSQVELFVVLSPNAAPIIEEITSDAPTGAVAGTLVNFSARASDPDGDPVTYRWDFTAPEQLVVNAPTAQIQTSSARTHSIVSTTQAVEAILPDVSSSSPIKEGSVRITFLNGATSDNGLGEINASGSVTGGTINYQTGRLTLVSNASVGSGELSFSVSYTLVRNDISGTLTVSDPYGASVTQQIPSVLVAHGLVITSALSVDAVVLLDFNYQITANAPGPFTYLVTGLPSGLTVNPQTGTIGGRPTEVGTFAVSIRIRDMENLTLTDTKTLTIEVVSTRSARPPSPTNLQVFNDGVNPTYNDSTTEIPIRWTIARDFDATAEVPASVLEVRTVSDELKGTFNIAAGVDTYELSVSELVSLLGAKTTFVIYVYHYRNGLRSAGYDRLVVLKV